MYNRYIRNDQGIYTRIPQEENPPPPPPSHTATAHGDSHAPPCRETEPKPQAPPSVGRIADGLSDTLRQFLDRLHLDHVDTGDLLLLGLLFFLFREGADEELLAALGLLLIL